MQRRLGLIAGALALAAVVRCAPAPGGAAPAPLPSAPAAGPEQPEGHRRMLALLDEVQAQAAIDNPFFGTAPIERRRQELEALGEGEPTKRWWLDVYLGNTELRLGHNERAVQYLLEANRLLERPEAPVPPDRVVLTLFQTALAYMRWGETQNCVARHTSESCIFPIKGQGVHADKRGAAAALEYLERVLDLAPPTDPTYVRARWLLNIVSMTLGRYPQDVPPQLLIPPEAFASDEPFPHFVDVAPELSLNTFDLAGGVVLDDFDGDDRLDVLVSTMDPAGPMHLFVNRGDGRFVERTTEAGLAGLRGGLNMVQADYDNDGDVDVLVLRGAWMGRYGRMPNSLLRNNGDLTFTDVTFEAGLGDVHYPTQTAVWTDLDNDGAIDLYIGNENGKTVLLAEGAEPPEPHPCQLFRNNRDGTFTDIAAQAGVLNLRYTKGVVAGDFDSDRDMDLYLSNIGGPNRLFRNNGDLTFTDVAPELEVTEPIASFPVFVWDPNNDGALDLFVTAYGGPNTGPDVVAVAGRYTGLDFPHDLPRLYLNDGRGHFEDRAAAWGLAEPTLPMGANFGDLDNDGYADFYLGTGYPAYEGLVPNVMYHNRAGRDFANVTTAGGFGHLQKGHGVAFGDLDNDGDQDIFEQMGGAYPGDGFGNVLFANPGFGNHWLKVKLVGTRSNRSAVGARVRVEVEEGGKRRSVYTWVGSGGSFGSGPLRREIGLGRAARVETLEVFWPTTGETQRFGAIEADQLIEIEEGRPDWRVLPLPSMPKLDR